MGNLEGAAKCFERSLELRPTHPEALVNLGRTELERENFPEAEELSLRAIQVNPYLASAYNNLGIVRLTQKEYQEAATLFKKALALAHNS